MLASAPKWKISCALQIVLAYPSSKTMPTVCLERGAGDLSEALAHWPRRAFTKRRTFSVARVARSLSMRLHLLIGQKSFGKRERIESDFFKVWSTNIHGSTWVRAFCLQTCLLRFSTRNWKLGMLFKRNEGLSGIAIIMN